MIAATFILATSGRTNQWWVWDPEQDDWVEIVGRPSAWLRAREAA